MPVPFSQLHTPSGHLCGEVASALQKSIRRGWEREALYFASELDLAGYGNYVWKRLRIIASEDVGLADPSVAVLVRCLYENWLDQRKADKSDSPTTRLFTTHAVIALCRAKKSRLVDHALIVAFEGPRDPIEIPDVALDIHTARGRKLKRGAAHFYDEGAVLGNQALIDDPYYEEARVIDGAPPREPSSRS